MMWKWEGLHNVESTPYKCGHCGRDVSSEKGWDAYSEDYVKMKIYTIRICHLCKKPTFFDLRDKKQIPGETFGYDVEHIDDELINKLYKELRDCMKVSAYTPAVLAARKILMHIAVSKGAEKNKSFIDYVEYLSENNYIPPDAKGWVDHIRKKGNEANHEIVIMNKKDAEDLISFIGILLKVIYEFPHTVPKEQED